MDNEFLFLIKKRSVTLIEQTKTNSQETLEFQLDQQMDTFSFNPAKNLCEEGKRLISVAGFEATNSVSNKTDENNQLLLTTSREWIPKNNGETFNMLKILRELRSQIFIELH